MRIADFVITAAVVAGLSGSAMAQTPSTSQTAPAPAAQANTNNYNNNNYSENDHWVASAFVGTNFGTGFSSDNLLGIDTSNTNTSFNFGGQVAYLWGGYVGVEGLAEFSPSFELTNILFENKPDVNTYMANGIVAGHWGEDNRFMPYASGGIGAVQMHSKIFVLDTINPDLTIGTLTQTGSRFGWDLGAGVMGFAGKWGFRGDVRYYRATTDNNVNLVDLGTGDVFTQGVLSGLRFWKANAGVAYRW